MGSASETDFSDTFLFELVLGAHEQVRDVAGVGRGTYGRNGDRGGNVARDLQHRGSAQRMTN